MRGSRSSLPLSAPYPGSDIIRSVPGSLTNVASVWSPWSELSAMDHPVSTQDSEISKRYQECAPLPLLERRGQPAALEQDGRRLVEVAHFHVAGGAEGDHAQAQRREAFGAPHRLLRRLADQGLLRP